MISETLSRQQVSQSSCQSPSEIFDKSSVKLAAIDCGGANCQPGLRRNNYLISHIASGYSCIQY